MQSRLDRAKAIQGWMSDFELDWLARMASQRGRIVEVGSWKGRSTAALAEYTSGIVFAVDTWKGSAEHKEIEIGPAGALFKQFIENTKGLPVLPIMGTSLEAAKHFKDSGFKVFDMIFIDGDHAPESVSLDIQAWKPLLQDGGLLCGHDYGTWPGLKEAVDVTLGQVEVTASIWYKEF